MLPTLNGRLQTRIFMLVVFGGLITLVLTVGYMVLELVGGYLAGSLALIADAGHMLSDAASLALSVSEKIRTQVRGTNAAGRNAGDGIALCNIAEGALTGVCPHRRKDRANCSSRRAVAACA